MQKRLRILPPCLVMLALVFGGCSTPPKSAEEKAAETAMEAPLGSRIKKRQSTAPVSEANRQQIEQQRAQQGAMQAGAVNNPSKYSGRN